MDKNILTSADIKTLKNTASKLKPNEIIVGRLVDRTINTNTGMSKTIKKVEPDYIGDKHEIIDFTSAPILGEGIKGAAIIDAFKSAQTRVAKKEPFSLKRTFFQIMSKAETIVNNKILNLGRVIYNYDEFGRVYFTANNKRHYINKAKTQCITEEGYFADIILLDEEGNFELEYYDNEDAVYTDSFINFDYMYISLAAAKEGHRLIQEEEDRQLETFITENPMPEESAYDYFNEEISDGKSNVIDLEEYRRRMEDEGPKR